MRATKSSQGRSQYHGKGEHCGLNTASEVFPIFTTQQCSCLCKYYAIVFIP